MPPRIPIDIRHLDDHGVGDVSSLVPGIAAGRQVILDALQRMQSIDLVTHELCRLLNANLQRCNVCLRYRYGDTDEAVLGTVTDYERSPLLSDRQKLALRLSDLYLRDPAVPSPTLAQELVEEFTPVEILELLLRQVRYTWNKTLVALGLDGES